MSQNCPKIWREEMNSRLRFYRWAPVFREERKKRTSFLFSRFTSSFFSPPPFCFDIDGLIKWIKEQLHVHVSCKGCSVKIHW